MGATPTSYIPMIITETEGRIRPILLAQSTMPHRKDAISMGVHIRGVTRWYPGSSEATSQVLGAQYPPLKFSGMFEDRKMGIPGAALALCLYIEQVVKSGREVTLVYGPLIRRCRWTKFDYKPMEFQRIRYSVELEPIGDGLGKIRKRIRQGLRAVPDTETPIEAAVEARTKMLELTVQDAQGNVVTSIGEVIALESKADGILTSQQIILKDQAQAALSSYQSAEDSMRAAYEQSQRISTLGGPDPSVTLPSSFSVLEARASVIRASTLLREVTQRTALLAGKAESGAVYIVSEGDSLRRLAQDFYGDGSRWVSILEHNGLTSPVIVAGQQLSLPDVPQKDLQVIR